MRIAISGTACQGKTTLINDIKKEWPSYTIVDSSYRKIIKEKNAAHSKDTTPELQWDILNSMIDDLQKNGDKGNKVLFDRCPFDNIVYTIWANARDNEKFTDDFVQKCIPLVRESMRYLDIIFFLPITKVAPVSIEQREDREIDEQYIKEIDNIFKSIVYQQQRTGVSVFLPKDDSPGIIEVFGKPYERIHLIKQYLDGDGDLMGGEGNLDSLLTPDAIENMSKLIAEQKEMKDLEDKEKDLYKKFGLSR
jgi:predicted ATPase